MSSIDEIGGAFRVRWRDPDGMQRTKRFQIAKLGRKRARSLAEVHKREVDDDNALGRPWRPRVARRDAQLEDVMRAYLVDKARTMASQTLVRNGRALDLYMRYLGGPSTAADGLSRQHLADFFLWLRQPETGLWGRQRSQDTCRKQVEVVQLLWRWAYDQDDYRDQVGPPRKLEMVRSVPQHAVAPTWDEMRAGVLASTGWRRHLCVVLYATGLRCNQAMRLVWGDFDLERATMTVRPELGKTRAEKRGRCVPIAPWLVDELRSWGPGEADAWLIPSTRTGPRERMARDRDMTIAWERSGVREEAWRGRPHHAFRKGLVSGLKRAGADDEAVEVLVGHSLGLRDVYRDQDALPLREAVALIPCVWVDGAVAGRIGGRDA